jgi:hybrid polyketide synthase/nonribosomal peptide synthetase ACE1
MMAVGTSMDDAQELCDLEDFEGRIQVAASNSSASITLSGDMDAIKEAHFIFEDERKFARPLEVDTAYHSYHMNPCTEPYLRAMTSCKIEITTPNSQCRWFSSVLGGKEMGLNTSAVLTGTYWRDNLVQPVLFSQAMENALSQVSDVGLILEVGPHAALRGPVSLTVEETSNRSIPYTGLLSRNSNDLECFSDGIGFVWANLSGPVLDFKKVDALCASSSADVPRIQKTVPKYSWDHDRKFWMEARQSAVLRLRSNPHHELLGIRVESGDRAYRWRNFMKPNELSWTKGHQVQSQLIFPGAGFSIMAVEAGRTLVPTEEITLIELTDIEIMRAMTFQDENDSVETQCSLTKIIFGNSTVSADFSCDICLSKDLGFVEASRSRVKLYRGSPNNNTLPDRVLSGLPMSEVDIEYFYQTLWDLGYNYTGMFKSVTTLKRTTDSATGVIRVEAGEDYATDVLFHPGPLDVAFQTIFGELKILRYNLGFQILMYHRSHGGPR